MFCSNTEEQNNQCNSGNAETCAFHNAIKQILSNTTPAHYRTSSGQAFHRNVSGKPCYFMLSAAPLNTSKSKLILLSMEDITRLKEAEEEAERFKRMHALGNLAGRIAHDLNNICSIVLGNISLAHLTGKLDENASEIVDNIENAILKAADLGQELLTFSNGGAPLVSPLPLNELIGNIAKETGIKHEVMVKTIFPDNLWPVMADEEQINMACRNIFSNAAEAIATIVANETESTQKPRIKPYQISVTASNKEITERESALIKKGRYVNLSISDNGIGISPDDIDLVTTPFFTKKQGKEGIGLSAAWSIIDRHHGKMNIESNKDDGTTVSLLIPAAPKSSNNQEIKNKTTPHRLKPLTDSDVFSLQQQQVVSSMSAKKKGSILFMDDNKVLRLATGELLKYLGWEVTETADGAEAVQAYKKAHKSKHPFDIVILDLTVPEGMGGLETIEKLIKIDPDVKAIVSSGYHNDPIMANFWEYGFCDCIKKPYMATRLNNAIHNVLYGK